MIRLDYLHNPPLNDEASRLLCQAHPYPSPVEREPREQEASAKSWLCERLGMTECAPFSQGFSGWLSLFVQLSREREGAIGVSQGCVLEAVEAAEYAAKTGLRVHLLPLEAAGRLGERAEELVLERTLTTLVLPSHTEDLFVPERISFWKERLGREGVVLVEANLALHLRFSLEGADGVLLGGARLGLPDSAGALLHKGVFPLAFEDSSCGLYQALQRCLECLPQPDCSIRELYRALKEQLGEAVFPLGEGAGGEAVGVGFEGIRARKLLSALQIDGICVINGQRCLRGRELPSHVLMAMGLGEARSRELLSLSALSLQPDEVEDLARTITLRYKQIRLLG